MKLLSFSYASLSFNTAKLSHPSLNLHKTSVFSLKVGISAIIARSHLPRDIHISLLNSSVQDILNELSLNDYVGSLSGVSDVIACPSSTMFMNGRQPADDLSIMLHFRRRR